MLLYCFNPTVFERYFFFNELISLIGFGIFLSHLFLSRLRLNKIDKIYYLLLLYFIYRALISLLMNDGLTYYLRHSVIIFSMFSYFVGHYIYKYKIRFLKLSFLGSLPIVLSTFSLIKISFSITNASIFFTNYFKKMNPFYAILLFFILWVNFTQLGSDTTVLCIFILSAFLFLSKKYIIVFLRLMFISGIAIFILINPLMKELYGLSDWSSSMVLFKSSYENIEKTILPNNIFTRIVMWHQVLVELFPTNLIGVGIGTMLWPHPHVIQPIGEFTFILYWRS